MNQDQARAYEAILVLRRLREQDLVLRLLTTFGLVRCRPWLEYIPPTLPSKETPGNDMKGSEQ